MHQCSSSIVFDQESLVLIFRFICVVRRLLLVKVVIMSGSKGDKVSFKEVNCNRLVDSIKKLKMITTTVITQFDQKTSLKILLTYEQLLETYWQNCTSAKFEAGSDVPYCNDIFWLQMSGDLRYQEASEMLTELLIRSKVCTLTKTYTFACFHRVTYQIYHFDQSTIMPMLEISVELLEKYWLEFSNAYDEIVKGNIVPDLVANVYFETESFYINAKIKIKNLLLNQLQCFNVPNIVEANCDQNSDYIIESVDQVAHSHHNIDDNHDNINTEHVNENTDHVSENIDVNQKFDNVANHVNENTVDLITQCNELDEPPTHINNNSVSSTIPNFYNVFVDWVRSFWQRRREAKNIKCFTFCWSHCSD